MIEGRYSGAQVRDIDRRRVEEWDMIGMDQYIGPQLLTVFFPLGAFLVGLLWLALQRRPNR